MVTVSELVAGNGNGNSNGNGIRSQVHFIFLLVNLTLIIPAKNPNSFLKTHCCCMLYGLLQGF